MNAELLPLISSFLAAAFWLPNALEMWVGYKFVRALKNFEKATDESCPKISIVVAAKDEDERIGDAIRSMLDIDYPHLEIVAVNDRSEDRTGEVLDELSQMHPKLRVIHIKELPERWLGKTHALYEGSKIAQGEYLLFTDADVKFSIDSLRRSGTVIKKRNPDHLVALPEIPAQTFWGGSVLSLFFVFFNFRFRAWQASWKWAPGHIGVGAFNMVRKSVYEKIGGHKSLRLNIIEDVGLGKLIKRSGFRQVLVTAYDDVSVPWAQTVPEAEEVMIKNAFAGLSFSYVLLFSLIPLYFIAILWPFLGLAFFPGTVFYLSLAALGGMLLTVDAIEVPSKAKYLLILTWPISHLIFTFIILKSAWITTKNGGVSWRGTFYPIKLLRNGLKGKA